jgi:hypothetical protein
MYWHDLEDREGKEESSNTMNKAYNIFWIHHHAASSYCN